ncbi:outer membrane protein assembly factor BamB [Halorhodospira abdelmalekii]|uniref:outer membrane protein assembly factor BamB n=1 Tax=Halorhodospira abdelmalekii TaxID=421629 RepID=UPI0019071913
MSGVVYWVQAPRVALLLLLALAVGVGCSLQRPLPQPQVEPQIAVDLEWSGWPVGPVPSGFAFDPQYRDGQLYLADARGWVRALDVERGETVWHHRLERPLASGPVLVEGMLLLGDRKGRLQALEPESGEVLWQTDLVGELLGSPRYTRGVVVARTGDGRLFGLDGETGERLWVFDRGIPALTLRHRSAPAVTGGTVVVGLESGRLVALNANDGSVRWEHVVTEPRGRTELERMADIAADPVIDQGLVFAVAYQGHLTAVRMATGSAEWSREVSSFRGFHLDGEKVYVAGADGRVWAFDRRSGATVWRQEQLRGLILTRPVAVNGYLVAGDNAGYVNWLRLRDGELVARERLSSVPIERTPVVTSDGCLYVLDARGRLTALRAASE